MAQLRFPFKGFDIALKKLRIPHRQPLMIRVLYHLSEKEGSVTIERVDSGRCGGVCWS